MTQGPKSDFTLNFIGSAKDSDVLNEKNVAYSAADPNNVKAISLLDNCNIIVRNVDDGTMKCNLVYTLSLKKNIKTVNSKPLEIEMDFSNPKTKLKIMNVTGKVIDGNNNSRNGTLNDVVLNEKTLYEDDYYLDNGRFDMASFI